MRIMATRCFTENIEESRLLSVKPVGVESKNTENIAESRLLSVKPGVIGQKITDKREK